MKKILITIIFRFYSFLLLGQGGIDGYVNVFYDHFDGNSLRNEYNPDGDPNCIACWDNNVNSYLVQDGNLWLKTFYSPGNQCTLWNGTSYTKDYIFQDIYTKKFYKYGRFSLRAKVPGNAGLWPGFWMYGGTSDPSLGATEIDIFEIETNNKQSKTQVWLWDHNGRRINTGNFEFYNWWSWTPDKWSTYILDWTDTHLWAFYDGIKVANVRDGFGHGKMEVIVGIAPCIPGTCSWNCSQPVNSEFPISMPLDYLIIDYPIDTDAIVLVNNYINTGFSNSAYAGKQITMSPDNGSVIVKGNDGSNLDLIATNKIVLKPGFHAEANSLFRAWIVGPPDLKSGKNGLEENQINNKYLIKPEYLDTNQVVKHNKKGKIGL